VRTSRALAVTNVASGTSLVSELIETRTNIIRSLNRKHRGILSQNMMQKSPQCSNQIRSRENTVNESVIDSLPHS
jgi:hypothetical protein